MPRDVNHQTRVLHHLGPHCKTIDILADELQLTHRQLSNAAARLIGKGFLERIYLGCFQLTQAGRQAVASRVKITSGPNEPLGKPRKSMRSTLRQRAWNVIRIQRKFTIPDLLTTATLGTEGQAESNLQRYCRTLCQAEVLRKLPYRQRGTSLTSNGFSQFVLIRDLGELAPVHRKNKRTLFDHNSGEEIAL